MISPPPPPCHYGNLLAAVSVEHSSWPVPGSYKVQPRWRHVDRPVSTAWVVRPDGLEDPSKCLELAHRLARLITEGRAFSQVVPRADVNGQTYMSASQRFSVMELEQDIEWLEQEELS